MEVKRYLPWDRIQRVRVEIIDKVSIYDKMDSMSTIAYQVFLEAVSLGGFLAVSVRSNAKKHSLIELCSQCLSLPSVPIKHLFSGNIEPPR